MKISMFHLMPHRDLPADFEQRYHSVWVDPPWNELCDAKKVGQYYNWTLDELIYAAKSGMDGICVNEHHQNAYGFMPNPNLMGSVLARASPELMRTVEVDRGGEDERRRPEVDRVELERVASADVVGDQPDHEPGDCHRRLLVDPMVDAEYPAADRSPRAGRRCRAPSLPAASSQMTRASM